MLDKNHKNYFNFPLPEHAEPYVLRLSSLMRENYDIATVLDNPFPMRINLSDIIKQTVLVTMVRQCFPEFKDIEYEFTSDLMLGKDITYYAYSNKNLYRAMATTVLDERCPNYIPRNFRRGEMFV